MIFVCTPEYPRSLREPIERRPRWGRRILEAVMKGGYPTYSYGQAKTSECSILSKLLTPDYAPIWAALAFAVLLLLYPSKEKKIERIGPFPLIKV